MNLQNRLSQPKTGNQGLGRRQRVPKSALREIDEVGHIAQTLPKKKRASNEPAHPDPVNSLTHEVEYLKREIEE